MDSWVGKIPWRRERLPTPVFLGFPGGSAGKESACNAGDLGSVPGLGRSPGEGKGCPLQYSGLENSTDCIVHGVAKSRTRLGDSHFTSQTDWWFCPEKGDTPVGSESPGRWLSPYRSEPRREGETRGCPLVARSCPHGLRSTRLLET